VDIDAVANSSSFSVLAVAHSTSQLISFLHVRQWVLLPRVGAYRRGMLVHRAQISMLQAERVGILLFDARMSMPAPRRPFHWEGRPSFDACVS
jgi:hypothetical protein